MIAALKPTKHLRISERLLEQCRRHPEWIALLLQINQDERRGVRRKVNGYVRMFRVDHRTAARLIGEYRAHRDDLLDDDDPTAGARMSGDDETVPHMDPPWR